MPRTMTALAAMTLAASGSLLIDAAVAADAPPHLPDAAHLLDGGALYQQRCASCHDTGASRAPPKAVLADHSPSEIFDALKTGAMAQAASGLSDPELDAIAVYLTGKAPVHATDGAGLKADICTASIPPVESGAAWNGWSPTLDNARFQARTTLNARVIARLKMKWSFAFTGGVAGQPTVVGGRVYLGTGSGAVYSLDARTGCVHWRVDVEGGVRSAAIVGPLVGPAGGTGRLAVFVGDRKAGVHALDAATGQEIWSAKVDSHPFATITGSPVLYRDRLYVPVSSSEEISTLIKGWRCCTFRGHVTALDASNGKTLWTTHAISDAPKPYRIDPKGGQLFGPAGAAIWSAPTIDPKRGVLYVATGDSYSDAPNIGSDAIIAMDLLTGKVRWTHQVTPDDNYLVGCTGKVGEPAACPRTVGSDFDLGASPVLRDLPGGRTVLIAGQKSGAVTALDPDHQGRVLWQTRLGNGGALGGVEWGMAADRDLLFVPIADPYAPKAQAKRGMYALRIADGGLVWSNPAPEPDCAVAPKGSLINICTSGLSSAPTAIPGLVMEGSLDGIFRVYEAGTGRIVWCDDIGQTQFRPVNRSASIKGDTMNAAGPTVAGSAVYQISGYQSANPKAVNLLLAFTVDGR